MCHVGPLLNTESGTSGRPRCRRVRVSAVSFPAPRPLLLVRRGPAPRKPRWAGGRRGLGLGLGRALGAGAAGGGRPAPGFSGPRGPAANALCHYT